MDKKLTNFPISLGVRILMFSVSVYLKYVSKFDFLKKKCSFKTFNVTLCNLTGCYRITAKHTTSRSANHEAGRSRVLQRFVTINQTTRHRWINSILVCSQS